jgi:hypothetical protein
MTFKTININLFQKPSLNNKLFIQKNKQNVLNKSIPQFNKSLSQINKQHILNKSIPQFNKSISQINKQHILNKSIVTPQFNKSISQTNRQNILNKSKVPSQINKQNILNQNLPIYFNKQTMLSNSPLINNFNSQNNIYNKNNIEKYKNDKYDIIFGLTCHENILCVKDLIDNINKFCKLPHLILISCTNNLYEDILKLNYENIIITNIRDIKYSIWGHIDLFYQHIINMEYLIKNNINYTYYWFLASNELFIKPIKLEFIEKNMFKIIKNRHVTDEEYNIWYNNFINNKNDWRWFMNLKRDIYSLKFFKENKMFTRGMQHEGLVLDNNMINEIYNVYNRSNINILSTNRNWIAEEIFISSYIYSKYILDKDILQYTCRYNYNNELNKISEPKLLIEKIYNMENFLSIKPVKRDYNNPIRKYIREMNY